MANRVAVMEYWSVKIFCSAGAQVSENTRVYKCTAAGGLGALDTALASGMDAFFGPKYKALMSAVATYRGVLVQRIFPLPLTADQASAALVGLGTVVGDLLPRQTSGLIKLRTFLGGRAERGRTYVPFPSEASNSVVSFPDAAYMVNLQALANAMELVVVAGAGADTSDMTPVIFHRPRPLPLPARLIDNTGSTIVTGIAVEAWATQRRRGTLGQGNISPV